MGLSSITRGTFLAHVFSTGEKTTGDSQGEKKTERDSGRVGGVTKQKEGRHKREGAEGGQTHHMLSAAFKDGWDRWQL